MYPLASSAQGLAPASNISQLVASPLTKAAIFLVVTINGGDENRASVLSLCTDLSALLRSVGFRDLEAGLSCIMSIGSDAWDRLFGSPRPAMLHPFREIHGQKHTAVATPGDLLFHIRAKRMDLCFELETQIMTALGDAVAPTDEVQGFRYFDDRDLIGFVDGTENPRGQAAVDAVVIGDEDPAFAGGSYVLVQKYLHDMQGWDALPTEAQEKIIGRKKSVGHRIGRFREADFSAQRAHHHHRRRKRGEDPARQHALRPARAGEFGTYFIGYCRSPRPIEQMLENMFIGRPPGNYDRLLDFSRAVTGNLFFVPSSTFLEAVADMPDNGAGDLTEEATENQSAHAAPSTTPAVEHSQSIPAREDGSLGIGSLKGDFANE